MLERSTLLQKGSPSLKTKPNLLFLVLFLTIFQSIGGVEPPCSIDEFYSRLSDEMNFLKWTEDPRPDPSIQYLVVLSGSNTYLKSRKSLSGDDEDDYLRMQLAIKIGREVASLRSQIELECLDEATLKAVAPIILYPGSKGQNADLKTALDQKMIKNYPKEKFWILDIPEEEINTKGQFITLKTLELKDTSVGIVTHAYHFPRISRMLGQNAPLYPFKEDVTTTVFLVDRQFCSPGIQTNVENEIKKIPNYVNKGDLALES